MAAVIVVTPNPAVDVTYAVGQQRIGETVRVCDVTRRAGGKGINVARVLHALEIDVVTVQLLGGAAGAWIGTELAAAGIECVAVPVPGETRTTVTITDDHEHPTVLAEPGPAVDGLAWGDLVTAVRRQVQQGSRDGCVVVLSGSCPPGVGGPGIADLVSTARAAGALVVADVSGPALAAAASAGAHVLKPNAQEALEATEAADLDEALAKLLAAGAGSVVVSSGAQGLTASTGPDRIEHPAVPGVTGNPTGAGDAATAGIVLALLAGAPPPIALRWAALLGAAAVLRPTAGDVDLDDLPDLARRLPEPSPELRDLSLPTRPTPVTDRSLLC